MVRGAGNRDAEAMHYRKLLFSLAVTTVLAACATVDPEPDSVTFAAREWTGHGDGRSYGGTVNGPDRLQGTLGSYRGCLVEARSNTLILLSGAMEFHRPDGHSTRDHVYSRSLLGDRPAQIVDIGSKFSVEGLLARQPLENIRLEAPVPAACGARPIFVTSTETFRPG